MSLPQNYNAARTSQVIEIISRAGVISNRDDRESTVLMFVGSTFDLLVGEDRSQVDNDLYPDFRIFSVDLANAKACLNLYHAAQRESGLKSADQVAELTNRISECVSGLQDVLGRLMYHRFGVQSRPA
jgi:hypothetical protein